MPTPCGVPVRSRPLLNCQASRAIDQRVRAGEVLYLSAGAATRDEFYELKGKL
jgi:hypothetical protein